jgi:hypothetical protein
MVPYGSLLSSYLWLWHVCLESGLKLKRGKEKLFLLRAVDFLVEYLPSCL